MTGIDVNFDDGPKDCRHFHIEAGSIYYQGIDIRPDHISTNLSDGTSDEICWVGRIIEVCNTRPSLERVVRDHKVSHPQCISFPG